MRRRHFLGVLSAAGAGVAIGSPLLAGLGGSSSTGRLLPSALPLPPPFLRPLRVPPVLRPTLSGPGGDVYDIVQQEATAQILPAVPTPVLTYGGVFPGPTVESRSGRPAVLRHHNRLPVPTVVHLHGGHTPSAHDGFPTDLSPPGSTREYHYPMDQRAATLWYHDHRMDHTGPSVWRGLAGFHLIRDAEEDRLPLPRGERDVPLLIADRSFAADGTLAYPARPGHPGVTDAYAGGVLGDVITVNGIAWPHLEVAATRHRLRLLNGSNARRYRLTLDPPGRIVQIGTDGGLLAGPLVHDAIDLAPGQRCDVIVDFGQYRPADRVELVNSLGAGTTRPVMQFRIGRRLRDDTTVPAVLSEVEPLNVTGAPVRTFHFRQGSVARPGMPAMPGWLINGAAFDPERSDAYPRLGQTEVWQLVSDLHHPVHVHLNQFQVLSRGLGGPGPYDAGWKDTIDLRQAEEARIAVRFTAHAGRFLLHCHNLEHEDMAMMAAFVTS